MLDIYIWDTFPEGQMSNADQKKFQSTNNKGNVIQILQKVNCQLTQSNIWTFNSFSFVACTLPKNFEKNHKNCELDYHFDKIFVPHI